MLQSLSDNKCLRKKKCKILRNLSLMVFVITSSISCSNEDSFYTLFHDSIILEGKKMEFKTCGNVEDLYCNDSVLITYNSGLDCSFTMYNLETRDVISEFGIIGHGHNEIPTGCFGDIFEDNLVVFKDVNKIIANYSLSKKREAVSADTIIRYELDETMLSYIVPVDSERYLGLGAYKWNKHFVLFDTKGHVYDSTTSLYNATDDHYNKFTKYLSNQGVILRHPKEHKYVGTTNNSGIINFMKIKDGHIYHIKDYNIILPSWEVVQSDKMNRVVWTDKTINGFLDLSCNEKNVFALYSEETMEKRSYISNIILMFDWEGNPKKKINIDRYVQQIAVNNDTLYALFEDKEGDMQIIAYSLVELD